MSGAMLEIISLGAGVQSTTMALMAGHGEIGPMPAAAIFADTGAEPKAVYEHLDWLMSPNVLPFPVHVVKWRDLTDDILASARLEDVAGRPRGYVAPPFHTLNADGSEGMLRRECTQNYKLDPFRHELKRMLGRDPLKPIRMKKGAEPLVRSWVGISYDEVHRMKPSRERWWVKRYPLVEGDRRWTRGHCLEWLARHEYPRPPRSACVFCPYLATDQWRKLRNSPDDWEKVILVDRLIRDFPDRGVARLRRGGKLYVHASCTPLEDVDLSDPYARQGDMMPSSWDRLWANECEGMCGV